jgi:hypothetical protein
MKISGYPKVPSTKAENPSLIFWTSKIGGSGLPKIRRTIF